MDEKQIAEDMRELIRTSARSKTSRIREVFDHVEAALNAGVSRTAVLEKLNERGLGMNMPTFETALRRIRRERANRPATTTEPAQRPTASPVTSASPASAPTPPRTPAAPPTSLPAPPPSSVATSPSNWSPADRSDPGVLTEILNSVPDLDQLKSLAKRSRKP